MKKTVFLADRWVKFTLSGVTWIGYTYTTEGMGKDQILCQFVYCISKERKPMSMNFYKCLGLTYLEFIKKPEHYYDLAINNDILPLETQIDLLIRPVISAKTPSILANNCLNQLILN